MTCGGRFPNASAAGTMLLVLFFPSGAYADTDYYKNLSWQSFTETDHMTDTVSHNLVALIQDDDRKFKVKVSCVSVKILNKSYKFVAIEYNYYQGDNTGYEITHHEHQWAQETVNGGGYGINTVTPRKNSSDTIDNVKTRFDAEVVESMSIDSRFKNSVSIKFTRNSLLDHSILKVQLPLENGQSPVVEIDLTQPAFRNLVASCP